MSAANSLAQDIVGAFFTKTPAMPVAPQVNAEQSQSTAIADNTKALGMDENLSSSVNTFNADQLQSLLAKAIPGYQAINNQASSVIQSELSGQIPQDVQEQIQQSSNAAATAGGYGNSGLGRNATARDLGLTSLNLTQQGLSSAQSWMKNVASMGVPALFNPSSMFLTPEQILQNSWQNQQSSFQRNWANNVLGANASNAKAQAEGQIVADTFNLAESVYSGGMTGGGGGAGGASSGASQFGETAGDGGNSSMSSDGGTGGFDWMAGADSGGLL